MSINDIVYYFSDNPIHMEKCCCFTIDKDFNYYDFDIGSQLMNQVIDNNSNIYYCNGGEYLDLLSIPEYDINNNRLCMVFILSCKDVTNIMLNIYIGSGCKVWLNTQLIAESRDFLMNNIIVQLTSGYNYILVELSNLVKICYYTIRVNTYDNELKENNSTIAYNNYYLLSNLVSVFDNETELQSSNIYRFILFLYNLIDIDPMQSVKVNVYDSIEGFIESFEINFSRYYEYNLSKLKRVNSDYSYITFEFIYKYKRDHYKTYYKHVNVNDFSYVTQYLKNEARLMLNGNTLNTYDRLNLEIRLGALDRSIKTMDVYWETYKLRKLMMFLKEENHLMSSYYEPDIHFLYSKGYNKIFYKSSIYNCIHYYTVYIPKSYDDSKKYSLIIDNTIGINDWYSETIKQYHSEHGIQVNIACGGMTLGSYIGEAIFFDILSNVLSNYSIDRKKIFLIGFSNGAYAAWGLAQNYPHLFAGILTISGKPYILNLCNLSNMRVISICSKRDRALYSQSYEIPKKKLKSYGGFTGIATEEMDHNDIYNMLYKTDIIKELLRGILNEYPDKIFFRTERNRHCKAYWIEIHSILFGRKYASVKAEILSNDKIIVNIINSSGFTIVIPPQIDKRRFCIIVNKRCYNFLNYTGDKIFFYRKKVGFDVTTCERNKNSCNRKGTGVIDVYLGPLKIVVPDNASSTILNVAAVFSSPKTFTSNTNIDIKYPVISSCHIDEMNLVGNMILIGNNGNNFITNILKNNIPIKMSSKGFKYKGVYYEGEYCIMAAIQNPFDGKNTILVIESNNENLFKKNVFTRFFALPSYSIGIHAFLNNEALIYYNKKYFGIYEWGGEISCVNENISF